jgi:hypothetical protein
LLNPKELIANFLSREPERTVVEILDYDTNWVLVKAPFDPKEKEFNAMFLLSKIGNTVKPFLPFDAPDKYLKAINRKPIYRA